MQHLKQAVETAARLGTETELLRPHLEIHANRRAVIDGCAGIIAYDETCIKLNCGDLLLSLQGDALCLEHLNGGNISVSGTLVSLAFSSL